MAPALAVVLCLSSGYLIATMGSRWSLPAFGGALRGALSVGFGLGTFSLVFCLTHALGMQNLLAADLAVFGGLFLACFLVRSRGTIQSGTPLERGPDELFRGFVAISFAVALCVALACSVLRAIVHPHGEGWDAFSIWNLHARFLFRGGSAWRDGFSPLIPWSHPDYPLLLPAAIAHFWSYLGHESQAVPAVIGLAFTFSTVGVLYSSLALLRGRNSGMLGAIVLLATPFFIEQGTAQYADVPLSFFFLATISLLCLHDRFASASGVKALIVLSGLAAGFAAWTKNEGLLFLCAFVATRMLVLARATCFRPTRALGSQASPHKELSNGWSSLLPLAFGIFPVLFVTLWFKHFAPPNDLFPDRAMALHKLLIPSRYGAILRWYGKELLRFGDWWLVPGTIALAAYYFLANGGYRKEQPQPDSGFSASVITLALTLAGYFVIYLITPRDLYWHLHNSLSRLFLQLWPSAIFLFFLAAPLTVKKPAQSQNDP